MKIHHYEKYLLAKKFDPEKLAVESAPPVEVQHPSPCYDLVVMILLLPLMLTAACVVCIGVWIGCFDERDMEKPEIKKQAPESMGSERRIRRVVAVV